MKTKFFESTQLMPGVTAIAGLGGEYAYLVEGPQRALLIDGLVGVGSLKAFVRELTDKPVTLALTHGHIDHNGAAFEYGKCYIHPADLCMLYPEPETETGSLTLSRHTDPAAKLDFDVNGRFLRGNAHGITIDDVVKPCPIATLPIGEGDIFDLGDTQIEVLELPGHTAGTVVFLDHARRIVFSGDACNLNTLVGLPGSTSIEEYRDALKRFTRHLDAFDVMYGGHGTQPVDKIIISQAIELCEKILRREDDAIPSEHRGRKQLLALRRGPNFLPEDGTLCNIQYVETMLHPAKTKKML